MYTNLENPCVNNMYNLCCSTVSYEGLMRKKLIVHQNANEEKSCWNLKKRNDVFACPTLLRALLQAGMCQI